MICHYLGSGRDGEHKRGHSGAAEIQQATLQRKAERSREYTEESRIHLAFVQDVQNVFLDRRRLLLVPEVLHCSE